MISLDLPSLNFGSVLANRFWGDTRQMRERPDLSSCNLVASVNTPLSAAVCVL